MCYWVSVFLTRYGISIQILSCDTTKKGLEVLLDASAASLIGKRKKNYIPESISTLYFTLYYITMERYLSMKFSIWRYDVQIYMQRFLCAIQLEGCQTMELDNCFASSTSILSSKSKDKLSCLFSFPCHVLGGDLFIGDSKFYRVNLNFHLSVCSLRRFSLDWSSCRFGTGSKTQGSEVSKTSEELKRKARAER